MTRTFLYERRSNSGNWYVVKFTVEVTPNGMVAIEADFSLRETLNACLDELSAFIKKAMSEYKLGIAEFENRVNHGHPTHPINKGGFYYDVDGKLYRCDKHLSGKWVAPVSDLRRIIDELTVGKDDTYGLLVSSLSN
ncbi:MAG: hypothetical protein IJN50_06610 [Clostridia bacterium]|nr:hypothetical protein [Clostridia bacterium]